VRNFFTSLAFLVGVALGVLWLTIFPPAAISTPAWTPDEMARFHNVEIQQAEYRRALREAIHVFERNHVTSQYASLVAESSLAYSIRPRVLAALIVVESHGDPHAISARGAVGLTQIRPELWNSRRADLLVPEKNVPKGAEILAEYTKRYGLREGLHAYNGFGNAASDYAEKVLQTAGR
jgi:soluble lytic murein transglycosylase-like protein